MSHLSSLTLDALALDALDAEARARALAHLDGCERCRGDRDAAAELRAHFSAVVLPRRRVPSAPRRAWLLVPALAAIVVVFLVWPREPPPEIAVKGDAAWQVFAHRGDLTFAVHDGAELAAGDRIRFVVAPGAARYLLVASIDGAGNATIYYPYGAAASEPIAGPRVELPGSIVLDAAPGPERVFALLSDEPLASAAVLAELRAIGAGGPDAIRRTFGLTIPAVRAQPSIVFEKAPR
jgi:hypothetical protein